VAAVGRLYGRLRLYPGGVAARVLVVDDDPNVSAMLVDALAAVGYEVVLATDGQGALDGFAVTAPDLVVLDLQLPDTDGLVLCSRIRQISSVPIILCTGTPRRADAVLGFRLGADDCVRKPVDVVELQERVRKLLRRSG
jgi:DNA-binding response OmpR family regulator